MVYLREVWPYGKYILKREVERTDMERTDVERTDVEETLWLLQSRTFDVK